MHVTPVLDRAETQFVGLPKNAPGLHAAAGKPHGESVNVMIAAGGLAVFAHGCAPEFTAPDHQRVVKQAAGFQVFHQGRLPLVHVAADLLKIALQILTRPAVAVPVGVVKLHEPHAAFDEPAREKTVSRKRRLARFDAIQFKGRLAFSGEIDQLRRTRLHAAGHFVSRDPGVDSRVTGLDRALQVQVPDGVDGPALTFGAHVGRI